MKSYYEQRSILSDALCPHFGKRIEALFREFEIGGNLLTPDKRRVTANDPISSLTIVLSATVTRQNGQQRIVSLVIQPTTSGHPAVSILTGAQQVRHVVEVLDEDVRVAIPHLQSLIDETLQELAQI